MPAFAQTLTLSFLFFLLCCGPALTQTAAAPPLDERIAKLEQQVALAKGSAHNGWMLISAAIVGTLILLKFVDLVVGLRVSAEHEQTGLDLSQYGEEGYEAAH